MRLRWHSRGRGVRARRQGERGTFGLRVTLLHTAVMVDARTITRRSQEQRVTAPLQA